MTATPVKDSNDECAAVTAETEVNDQDDDDDTNDTVGATLTVLDAPLSVENANCDYDVVLDVPGGFVAASKGSKSKVEDFTPDRDDPGRGRSGFRGRQRGSRRRRLRYRGVRWCRWRGF